MQTVLLTGASGYIGQFALRHLLDKKYIVHAVTSQPFDHSSTENLRWHQANLLDAGETKDLMERVRPTHLLHFAWQIEHGKYWDAVSNFDWLQVGLRLGKLFAENGGERMVISGTCAEYDWTKPSPFIEYETPFNPRTLYGAAKSSLSLILERFAEVAGFSFASGKIFFPFGGNEPETRLLPSVMRALIKNEPAEISHGNQIRDFMFVEDVAEAFVALLESDARGAVNVASGNGVKIKDIAAEAAKIIGASELLRIGAIPAQENEPPAIVADVRRLREEVGWQSQFDLRKRLQETVNLWSAGSVFYPNSGFENHALICRQL